MEKREREREVEGVDRGEKGVEVVGRRERGGREEEGGRRSGEKKRGDD